VINKEQAIEILTTDMVAKCNIDPSCHVDIIELIGYVKNDDYKKAVPLIKSTTAKISPSVIDFICIADNSVKINVIFERSENSFLGDSFLEKPMSKDSFVEKWVVENKTPESKEIINKEIRNAIDDFVSSNIKISVRVDDSKIS